MKTKIVILTGAGISAESGIQTFRGADGLWEGHDVMEVASPAGWQANQELVLKFYNDRRRQLLDVKPNKAHLAITELSNHYDVNVITQNVDDLHERAGNPNVLHLHGELRKVRSVYDPSHIQHWETDLNQGDLCPYGHQLRPHIVWFGEAVPMLDRAIDIISTADFVWIIGTSMKVYPAASLIAYAPPKIEVSYIDPFPQINAELAVKNVNVIRGNAATEIPILVENCIKNLNN